MLIKWHPCCTNFSEVSTIFSPLCCGVQTLVNGMVSQKCNHSDKSVVRCPDKVNLCPLTLPYYKVTHDDKCDKFTLQTDLSKCGHDCELYECLLSLAMRAKVKAPMIIIVVLSIWWQVRMSPKVMTLFKWRSDIATMHHSFRVVITTIMIETMNWLVIVMCMAHSHHWAIQSCQLDVCSCANKHTAHWSFVPCIHNGVPMPMPHKHAVSASYEAAKWPKMVASQPANQPPKKAYGGHNLHHWW